MRFNYLIEDLLEVTKIYVTNDIVDVLLIIHLRIKLRRTHSITHSSVAYYDLIISIAPGFTNNF